MTLAQQVTADTIALVHAAISGGGLEEMIKAAGFTQPAAGFGGLQNFSLEKVAANLFPVITPFRNRIPRRIHEEGGTQANWKAFTAINSMGIEAGVADGNRGGATSTSSADYWAAFRQMGLEDFVTFGAQLSAKGFLDLRSRSNTNLLWALMIAEELTDIGGNTSMPLGQGNQPSAADVGTGGALAANTTYSVIVAPLTLAGFMTGNVVSGVRGLVTRTNADQSVDTYGGGTGKPSANRTVATASDGNATHALNVLTAPTAGAAGYAWFWGPVGAEVLGAITTINSLVITSAAGGTQTAASLGANDNSTNGLVYDGILTQVAKTGSGYWATMPTGAAGMGTPLTADGEGGVVEIDAALQWFWDTRRMSPTRIWCNSQERRNITKKVLMGSATGSQRFTINSDQGNLTGGDLVRTYLNKFAMGAAQSLPIELHPDVPPGTLMFDTDRLPYPIPGQDELLVKLLRQDYNATDWALKSRKFESGVYFDGVLQNYAPFAFGAISNIGNG